MNKQSIGLFATIGIAAAINLGGCKSKDSTTDMPSKGMATGAKTIPITVSDDGFSPSSIYANKGETLMLEFTRVSDKTCATKVVFPELGISKDLPLKSAVAIHVPTDRTRQLTFQCGMGMYKSSVVIM